MLCCKELQMVDTLSTSKTAPAGNNTRWHLLTALLLIASVTLVVYWQVLYNEFISYDDPDYVTLNSMVRNGLTFSGISWAFSAFYAANWHPLTWISHMLDVQLFGLNPFGHHASNLLFHILNSMVLCAVLNRLTGHLIRSMAVALLFAIHPLHVESVAWVSERKDVLSTFFWLLTMWVYCRYADKPSLLRYCSVVAFFALGLLSKPMLVTLPLILLLMDFWPLQRLALHSIDTSRGAVSVKSLLAEKLPLLLMSAVASIMTIRAQSSAGALTYSDGQSLLLCAGNAFLSYIRYIRSMIWPVNLALFYPFESTAVTGLNVLLSVLVLAALTWVVIIRRKACPVQLFGWFWYLTTLLPVIGIIRAGGQAMADRYTYIPLIGLFIMVVWGGVEIAEKWRYGLKTAGGILVITVTILSLLTITQIRYWQNSYELYRHALAVVERNWLAHNNIGILLSQHNRNDEALVHFKESVRLNPRGGEGFRNLANSLQMAGKNSEAITAYIEAVKINPNDSEGHFRLGYAYLLNGALDQAYQEYRQLQSLDEVRSQNLLDAIESQQKR